MTPLLLLLLGAAPADLAPGAPELQASERRLTELLQTAAAVQAATARLQVAWTVESPLAPPKPKPGARPKPAVKAGPCDNLVRLDLGWRIERFGAAWREAAQATRVEAERLDALRAVPTVHPLVDARGAARLDALADRADRAVASFLEASAWQERFVRPELARCPLTPLTAHEGQVVRSIAARTDTVAPIAVLAAGDGWLCPIGTRADDAVVLVPDGKACWSASPTCGCTPTAVAPGAVVGPPG